MYGNFLLGMPFGFGLPFLARLTHRRVTLLGLGFAAGIEVAQLVFAGTLVGYGVLWRAARVYQRLGWAGGARLPVWEHFHAVLLGVSAGGVRQPRSLRVPAAVD